jgi:hypothetical protein
MTADDNIRQPGAPCLCGVQVENKNILGEFVTTMEEGQIFGDLAFVVEHAKRACSVVANGMFDLIMDGLCVDHYDGVQETLLVEIPKASEWGWGCD